MRPVGRQEEMLVHFGQCSSRPHCLQVALPENGDFDSSGIESWAGLDVLRPKIERPHARGHRCVEQ
jgi:hypothetical protein